MLDSVALLMPVKRASSDSDWWRAIRSRRRFAASTSPMSRWFIIRNVSFILTNELLHPNPPVITFYFDLGSPYAYLAAERLSRLLPEPVRWQPVLLGGLFKLSGRSSWALGDERRRAVGMAEIERRVRAYGLPPMRWPDPWPDDYLTVMRATTTTRSPRGAATSSRCRPTATRSPPDRT